MNIKKWFVSKIDDLIRKTAEREMAGLPTPKEQDCGLLCKHDWVRIETNVLDFEYYRYPSPLPIDVCGRKVQNGYKVIKNVVYDAEGKVLGWAPERRVCLKCGKCYDGEIELREDFLKMERKLREKQERLELAKKLWTNCEKRVDKTS